MEKPTFTVARRSVGEWLSSLPTLFILLIVIFLSSGQIIHSQLLKIGESTWDEYFLLRGAGMVAEPSCNPDPDINQRVREIVEQRQAQADDALADILGGSEVDEDAIRQSLEASRANCRAKWMRYKTVQEKVTPGVIAFRNIEGGVASVVSTLGDYKRLLLCLLVIICAATATLARHHIALRPPRTRKDHYVSTIAQLAANGLLLMSASVYRAEDTQAMASGVTVGNFYLHAFWMAGFALLTAASLYQLIRPPRDLEAGGSWPKAFLTIPLYTFMCLTASAQFISQGYYHGISVYLNMMMELSTLFLNLALYIWIGMLLKQTRLAHLVFDVLRPWKMSPELMCFVVLAVAAIPTAYTGASGIFVIAAGATIYQELIRVGARKQLALAATAMSGSMGVVLRPCLLVVIIAALNKSVTTAELFASGYKIFFLSLFLFFIYSQFARTSPARIAPFSEALPRSLKRLVPLMPYGIIVGAILVLFSDLLGRHLDEFSAPIILPVMLLAVLLFEKLSRHLLHLFSLFLGVMVVLSFMGIWEGYQALSSGNVPAGVSAAQLEDVLWAEFWRNLVLGGFLVIHYLVKTGDQDPHYAPEKGVSEKMEGALRLATNETTGHIGALLMLMALSVSTGGIIERSGVLEMLPETFSSIWVAMAILVVTMVIIGMFMDPYGAVILVNATIAQVAFDNGIAPLHFWMITLVAFELGYLTPPVALNHLLTRQVVGDDEVESAKLTTGSFFRRYEKFILPIAVMLTALLIVSFLPLISDSLHDWLFHRIQVG
ncbi:TRAP transporter large permease subunit [Alloalcanivorax gelatiniphagus]|uniref:TRAP transporter large permease subunit n=1 Tax=Alloalcanivorax gelatiniphagus TaxID=1194167 RepID=A0ABY2XNC8_9GAMM|nr:TRAP transporter large permease subunit [Alloalcanivorax gelatiniphagus]TMW13410.1 TRAP transporter large permease subunit [Alloalcanivorax gelatiniphagus]